MFFTDTRRGAVLRLGDNGLFEISSQGMKNWFKTNLKVNTQKLGIFDPYFEHYILASNNISVDSCIFNVNDDSVSIANGVQTNVYAFTIISNNEWYITVPTNNWITFNTLYGNDTTLIYYTTTANTGNPRSLTVTVTGCGGSHNVIFNQAGNATTTSTTTAGPTTTTSTTTAGPTTTSTTTSTTTAAPVLCFTYNGQNNNDIDATLFWTNCDGTNGSQVVSPGAFSNSFCARENSVSGFNFTINNLGPCGSPTTTTTSTTTAAPTTTSTTTVAPTTTTTSTTTVPVGPTVENQTFYTLT
jgi:hypothetical protein